MSEELKDEVEVLNSIYGPETLSRVDDDGLDTGRPTTWILRLPGEASSLRLGFPAAYPAEAPTVLGTHHSSGGVRGAGARDLGLLQEAIERVFRAGEVCLYDAVEDVCERLRGMEGRAQAPEEREAAGAATEARDATKLEGSQSKDGDAAGDEQDDDSAPVWTISEPIVENKSTFVARVATVSSAGQAARCISRLVGSERRLRDATHNMSAWRVREAGVVCQDCDDDGETAAGARLLHLMHLMGVWDAVVVVSRWYGGVKLGPRRFALINTAARDAFVRAGLVEDKKRAR
ncbi:hypothetical protein CDD82_4784 [Ophiocordyceps australis]|uniref:RWD domain-containing protein n=1 Tax=Ophiocordyceps australis TaxID=1399860 RepID=A0A2C5ZLF2_9HYPO|nr:hypothetical protein CDD82_4784 [Ophiocordyceps australis]